MPDAAQLHAVADFIENPLVMGRVVQNDVSAECYETARERPHVKIMNILNVRDGLEVITLDCGHNDCAPYWGEIREQIVRFMQISVPLA